MLALALLLVLAQSDGLSADELQALSAAGGGGPASEETLRHLVDQTLPKVARVMNLPAPARVTTRVISRDEARRRLLDILRREYPGDRLARLGILLKLVFLVEPDVDLEKAAHELYSQNASGFYDPHDRVLYLLKDQPAAVQGLVVAHELAHAVQDERMGLDRAVREKMDSEDAQLALAAAVEGNAQAVGAQVLASEVADGLGAEAAELMIEGTAGSAALAAQNSGATPWLGLQMRFPYNAGAGLVKAQRTHTDVAATQLLSRPPLSTAQVLAPELYRKNERPLQGTLGLARLLPGSVPVYETTLGRANLDLLGEVHANGADLGEGWRGDRIEAVRNGEIRCAAWAIAFSHPEQATRLVKAYAALLEAQPADSRFVARERDGTVSAVSNRGPVVIILAHVPPAKLDALEEAARSALH